MRRLFAVLAWLAFIASATAQQISVGTPTIVTVNSTTCTLGSSCTVPAAAGTLTGNTLAAGVTASSLTSLGTITSLTATTINAFTLGGNITGAGKLVDNVIIGSVTPSTAFFGNPANNVILTLSSTSGSTNPTKAFRIGTTGQLQLLNDAQNAVLYTIDNVGAMTLAGTLAVQGITSAATTSAVCVNTGTGLMTYNSTVGTCTVSTLAAKTLKSPLTPQEGLDLVMAMRPWRYELKKGLPTYVPGEQIGFVAEYTYKTDRRLVALNPDGSPAGVRYEQYTAALTGAIQALKAANDNLMREVQQLKTVKAK